MGTLSPSTSKILFKFRVNSAAYSNASPFTPEYGGNCFAVYFDFYSGVGCATVSSQLRNGTYLGVINTIVSQLNSSLHAATFADPCVIVLGPS